MSDTLDEEWNKLRGMEIQAVGIASISYDEESQKLINLRNKGAMMGDPLVREGYVQSTIAEGLKNAGGNANGALAGFMGMGMGMQSSGNFMGAASNTNMAQMQMKQMPGGQWQGAAGMPYGQGMPGAAGAPEAEQGQPVSGQAGTQAESHPAGWICTRCQNENHGKFCSECGSPRPVSESWVCSCGTQNTGKFCSECGKPRP